MMITNPDNTNEEQQPAEEHDDAAQNAHLTNGLVAQPIEAAFTPHAHRTIHD